MPPCGGYLIKRVTEERICSSTCYTVSVTKAIRENWQLVLTSVGSSLAGINGVNVSSEVIGTIIGINFESGKLVERGKFLI